VAVVLSAGGCSLAGRTFSGYMGDHAVGVDVKHRMADLHVRHLRRVKVDVYDRVVYLSGSVNTPAEKSDAEIAAWKVDGVEQVVNDLVVRQGREVADAISASPVTDPSHPLMKRFSSVTRVEAPRAGGPELAYDRSGRVVATVYTLGAREMINAGFTTLPADGRPIDHVSIYPIVGRDDLPEPQYAVVLWHVAESATGAR
jgi:BON domain